MNAPTTAAEILTDPAKVADADPAALPTILAQLYTATGAVMARMLAVPPQAAPQDPSDRLLKAEEAAAILGLSVDTLYKSAATKTLRVKIGTNVRFSHAAIQRYIARQRGK